MRVGSFEHREPKTLAEVCAILSEHGDRARIVAGGTDIIPRMKQRLLEPRILVNIKGVEEVRGIVADEDCLHIGSGVTLTDLQRSERVRDAVPILAEAASAVGSIQLQNMGTIGGNICLDTRCWYYNQTHVWRQSRETCLKVGGEVCHMAKGSRRCYALYSGDTAAALLALGASLILVSARGERRVSVEDFFVADGKKPTVLESDELIAGVTVPRQVERAHGRYLKFRRREAIDFPIVGVAGFLAQDEGVCRALRVAVTGVGSAPLLIEGIEPHVLGRRLSAELVDEVAEMAHRQAKPVSHMEVSSAYRKRLVRVLVRDSISQLANKA
ncbi:MAG: 4-hydroxybenzoyl-CoA reductase subunit beta [Chloroflexota bacterium]|nr:MAG: 4-hydroxybenzoyl-CoA reductase subunit beta [Chloroflexota bacterium]